MHFCEFIPMTKLKHLQVLLLFAAFITGCSSSTSVSTPVVYSLVTVGDEGNELPSSL